MKQIKSLWKVICGVLAVSFLFASCADFDELNVDPTRMDEVSPGALISPIVYETAVYNWKRYDSYTFQLMQCAVTTNGGNNGVGWWFVNDDAGDGTWSTYYKWINNAKEIRRINARQAPDSRYSNYDAVSLTLQCWLFQILTDAFGDIPMTEACSYDLGITQPKFETQLDVYRQLIDSLDRANTLFIPEDGLPYNASGELLYCSNDVDEEGMMRWKKFCNSLRLRVLLRVLDVPELNAREELVKMLADPETYPVFESNEGAALLSISGVYPEEAPYNRTSDFTAYMKLTKFFADMLNAWSDPRRAPLFTTVKVDGKSRYVGIPSGYAAMPSGDYSGLDSKFAKAPMDLAMLPYSEVEFIKAELYHKGIVEGGEEAAKEAYEKGVRASIEQFGAECPDDYFEDKDAAYNNTMERIMNQKFVALYFCDYQQWFEYNRTGLPVLPRGEGIPEANYIPSRFKYPAVLQRTNRDNYLKAKERMGGDELNVKLIWQK